MHQLFSYLCSQFCCNFKKRKGNVRIYFTFHLNRRTEFVYNLYISTNLVTSKASDEIRTGELPFSDQWVWRRNRIWKSYWKSLLISVMLVPFRAVFIHQSTCKNSQIQKVFISSYVLFLCTRKKFPGIMHLGMRMNWLLPFRFSFLLQQFIFVLSAALCPRCSQLDTMSPPP